MSSPFLPKPVEADGHPLWVYSSCCGLNGIGFKCFRFVRLLGLRSCPVEKWFINQCSNRRLTKPSLIKAWLMKGSMSSSMSQVNFTTFVRSTLWSPTFMLSYSVCSDTHIYGNSFFVNHSFWNHFTHWWTTGFGNALALINV